MGKIRFLHPYILAHETVTACHLDGNGLQVNKKLSYHRETARTEQHWEKKTKVNLADPGSHKKWL